MPNRALLTLLVALTAVALGRPVFAQQGPDIEPAGPSAPIVTEQVGGTSLTLEPNIAFGHASLRISGPEGYALGTTVLAGAPISVDLVADGTQSGASSRPLRQGATQPPIERLADGLYRYEVVFSDAAGQLGTHTGRFFVESGAAVNRASKRAQLGEVRRDLELARQERREENGTGSEPTRRLAYVAQDYILIDDGYADDETALTLDNDDYVPTGTYWGMANDYDLLELGRTDDRFAINYPYLAIEVGGEVGIGTTAPGAALHIVNPDYRVQRMTGGLVAQDFSFGVGNAGLFFYDDDEEAVVRFYHSAAARTLVVDDLGVTIDGGFAVSSSRETKTGFADVDASDLLARIAALPVQSWRFKSDRTEAQHVGPVAEDFHAAFGLGADETHISPADTAGIALLAIQELTARVDALANRNQELEAELDQLRETMEPPPDTAKPDDSGWWQPFHSSGGL